MYDAPRGRDRRLATLDCLAAGDRLVAVGYYNRGKLQFAGGVGTGYTAQMRWDLLAKLQPLSRERGPSPTSLAQKRAMPTGSSRCWSPRSSSQNGAGIAG